MLFRCSSELYEDYGPIHSPHVDYVPGVSGPPAGHGQLLHQLLDLLQRVQAVQGSPDQPL